MCRAEIVTRWGEELASLVDAARPRLWQRHRKVERRRQRRQKPSHRVDISVRHI